MNIQMHEFLPTPFLPRRTLESHQTWIEANLGVTLADVVIFKIDLDLTQIAVEKILGCPNRLDPAYKAATRLTPLLSSAQTPPGFPPLLGLTARAPEGESGSLLSGPHSRRRFDLQWKDCPVALRLHGIAWPVIALNAYYHEGPESDEESMACLLITKRDCAAEVVGFVEALDRRDTKPRFHVRTGTQGQSRNVIGISSCSTRALSHF
jgi:hypothetical protein